MRSKQPLVSVITPVYNGAQFLDACIDSVIGQSFDDFEYLVVDNCSSDDSLNIARAAAARDRRIRILEHDEHVGPIQNWNRSLDHIHPDSVWVKFVHADDWLLAECLERMIEVGARSDRLGLVSAYRLEEDRVSLDKLPSSAPLVPGEDAFVMEGREAARAIIREKASILGSPTSIMLRADLVRRGSNFFSEDYLHADKEACLRILLESDFGFVRQVLTFTRRHNESVTSLTNLLDTRRQENLLLLEQYGPELLSDAEFERTKAKEIDGYYRFLASNAGTGIGREFWKSHRKILESAGSPLRAGRLAYTILRRWANPADALKSYLDKMSQRNRRVDQATIRFLDASRSRAGRKDA